MLDTQWFASDVTLGTSRTGTGTISYWISETEKGLLEVPQEQLVYDTEGPNQGPPNGAVYIRGKNDNVIYGPITVGKFNIDKTPPTVEIDFGGHTATSGSLEYSLEADDAGGSKVAGTYYLETTRSYTENELKNVSWKTWDGSKREIKGEGIYYLYAKVTDNAGNVSYDSAGPLIIDNTYPVIKCNNKELVGEKTYVADKKTIVISDKNLSNVSVSGPTSLQKSGDDIENGSVEITLNGPTDTTTQSFTYTINAEDLAGNNKPLTITLKNPNLDVKAENLIFGSGSEQTLTYGYAPVEAQPVVLKQLGNGEPVSSIQNVKVEVGNQYFEVVNNRVRPVTGLHAGEYSAAIRVDYNGEAESTMTFRCDLTVDKAGMFVRVKDQTAYYHTRLEVLISEGPENLDKVFEFTAADFKNGDSVETLKKDPQFVWPSFFCSGGENGGRQPVDSNTRVLTDMKLQAEGGQSSDYVFNRFDDGDIKMERRNLPEGYEVVGGKKEGFEWYSSSPVTVQAKAGYMISATENGFNSGNTFTVSAPTPSEGNPVTFFVMNQDTEEISLETTETIKIDTSAPEIREGDGITVSNEVYKEFLNDITFGIFFNDTKTVTISATDEESGPVMIEYCVVDDDQVYRTKEDMEGLTWQTYENGFSISPEEYGHAVIYAKITNHAGLVTYISSNGMVFDNKQPDISKVENGREQFIIDEKEYITDELNLKVSDRNLSKATLFEGTDTSAQGTDLEYDRDEDNVRVARETIPCPESGSKTYTVVASDEGKNYTEREFTITKPIYDIKANTLKIKSTAYGYETTPQVAVTWENGETANADATISEVILSNTKQFEVRQTESKFWIAAKPDLESGTYLTDVTLVYNGDKRAVTTCSFTVEKATLTAAYVGNDMYYHEKIKDSAVKVTGFVKHNGVLETPETAAGYKEPVVLKDGFAKETCELTPSGGKADNYKFIYRSGLLLVNRRYANTGKDGQYDIDGSISDSGWYTSDIVIRPQNGYALLLNEDDTETQESIVLTKDTDQGEKKFFVTNLQTGEIYQPTTLYYKKDTVAPSIKGIVDGVTYVANTKEVTIDDDYLSSVTVNGEAKPVVHGATKISLFAEQETKVYVVVATDCAGNVTSKTIVMNQPESLSDDSDENYGEDAGVDSNSTPSPSATPKADSSGDSDTGTVKKMVKVVKGAPETSLTTSASQLKTSVLTKGELKAVSAGSNADIELRVRNIDSSIPQADKELIIANLNGYSIGAYLDITMWKKVGNSSEKKVTSTNKPVTVTVSIPESLRSASRQFAMFRVHNGAVSILPDRDSAVNTITFATDKFSTYVLAYKQGSGSQSYGNVSGGGSGSTGYSTFFDASPETGDRAPILPVSIAFVVSLAGILATITIRRRIR